MQYEGKRKGNGTTSRKNVYEPVYRDYQWNVNQFWHMYDEVPVKLCAMM